MWQSGGKCELVSGKKVNKITPGMEFPWADLKPNSKLYLNQKHNRFCVCRRRTLWHCSGPWVETVKPWTGNCVVTPWEQKPRVWVICKQHSQSPKLWGGSGELEGTARWNQMELFSGKKTVGILLVHGTCGQERYGEALVLINSA